jgi:hypothetical protein
MTNCAASFIVFLRETEKILDAALSLNRELLLMRLPQGMSWLSWPSRAILPIAMNPGRGIMRRVIRPREMLDKTIPTIRDVEVLAA